MKPIRIFRHLSCEGPGYLGEFLDQQGVEWELTCIDEERPVPMQVDDVSALIFMGAAVSVNDPYPWVEAELNLIRMAYDRDLPMMGICFGGQLISKALGGQVTRGAEMEVGWHPLYRLPGAGREAWLAGLPEQFVTFHWHAETFSLPPGSKPLLMSECYQNQGFTLGDHLCMQFHLEMTQPMVKSWVERYGSDLRKPSPCIQSAEVITQDLPERIGRLHQISDIIYGNWLKRVLHRGVID